MFSSARYAQFSSGYEDRIWQGGISAEDVALYSEFLRHSNSLVHGMVYATATIQHAHDTLSRPTFYTLSEEEVNPFGFYASSVRPSYPGAEFPGMSDIGMHVFLLFERSFKPPSSSSLRMTPNTGMYFTPLCLRVALERLTDSNTAPSAVVCISSYGLCVFRLLPRIPVKVGNENKAFFRLGGNVEFAAYLANLVETTLADPYAPNSSTTQSRVFLRNSFKLHYIKFDSIPMSKAAKQGLSLSILRRRAQHHHPPPSSQSQGYFPPPNFLPPRQTPSNSEEDVLSFCSYAEEPYVDDGGCLLAPTMTDCDPRTQQQQQQPFPPVSPSPPPPLPPPLPAAATAAQYGRPRALSLSAPPPPPPTAAAYSPAITTASTTRPTPLSSHSSATATTTPVSYTSTALGILPYMQELDMFGPRQLPNGNTVFLIDQVVQSLCPLPVYTREQQTFFVDLYLTLAEIFSDEPTENLAIRQYRRLLALLESNSIPS